MADITARFEVRVAPDGRITGMVDLAGDRPRALEPHSPEGLAILRHGEGVLYRFADDERLRDLPYPEVLDAMRQAVLLTAHKARHGEVLDEPEVLPTLTRLLAGIAATARDFARRAADASPDE